MDAPTLYPSESTAACPVNFTPAALCIRPGRVDVLRADHAFGTLADALAYADRYRYHGVLCIEVATGSVSFAAAEHVGNAWA